MSDKYPRTPHWPTSPGATNDDRWHSDPQKLIGIELVGTEKLDGQNTKLNSGQAYARSASLPAHHGWMAMAWKHHAWKTTNLGPHIDVFGEDIYGVHSIEYNPVYEDQTFRVFAVREGDRWLSWDDVELFCQIYDFITVPLLFRGVVESVEQLSRMMDKIGSGSSNLGPTIEGSVWRKAAEFHDAEFNEWIAKWVRKGHVQTDQHWTQNWKPCSLIRN